MNCCRARILLCLLQSFAADRRALLIDIGIGVGIGIGIGSIGGTLHKNFDPDFDTDFDADLFLGDYDNDNEAMVSRYAPCANRLPQPIGREVLSHD